MSIPAELSGHDERNERSGRNSTRSGARPQASPSLRPVPHSESHDGSLSDSLDDVTTAGGVLLAEAVPAAVDKLSRDDRRNMLSRVDEVVTRLQVVRTRLIAAEDASGDWASEGDKNMEAWLGRTTGAGYGPAKSDIDMARTIHDLPVVEQALENGTMTIEHVKAASRHYAGASEPQREALASSDGQEGLVKEAGKTDATRFNRQLGRDLAKIDAEKLERDRAAVQKRRYVKLVNHAGGVKLDGFLDPVAGEHLRTALDAASPRPAADDNRTGGQRRADALTTIAKTTLDSGSFKPGGRVRPHVMVTMSAAEWADWQRAGRVPSQAPAATVGDGIPLAPSETETMLCDCRIMRAVLDAEGQPVDLGREKRTFSNHLRKALQLRDKQCAWPGCTMPGRYTEGHHIDEWAENGATNIARGLLLCSCHHHFVHAKKIAITPIMNGFRFTYPDGRVAGEHHFDTGPPPEWARPPDKISEDRSARPPAENWPDKQLSEQLPLE